ncbi:MAG TPA: sulfite exporter TauE/SafE family protein [Acidobacteriaceae bacterium]|nr:sulfite exporter TauE/SafE family protein [Acidobacteriaceae bacterium]
MNEWMFSLVILGGSLLAGLLGSLTGLGGGVVLVPMLAILFKVDLRYAIGASLISVIATSSGSAAAYVREGFSNIRIGMFLEIATTAGAIAGAWLATRVPTRSIAIVFSLVLLYSVYLSFGRHGEERVPDNPWSNRLKMNGTFPGMDGKEQHYAVTNISGGFATMFGAGALSGLLGIGSGAVKVLAMDNIMRIPFKVSTTTSNFMIGVTAAASAGIYLRRGYIDAPLVAPVMIGVVIGSLLGAKLLVKSNVKSLRIIFSVVIFALAVEMIYSGCMGKV